jgi:hypothetical protein
MVGDADDCALSRRGRRSSVAIVVLVLVDNDCASSGQGRRSSVAIVVLVEHRHQRSAMPTTALCRGEDDDQASRSSSSSSSSIGIDGRRCCCLLGYSGQRTGNSGNGRRQQKSFGFHSRNTPYWAKILACLNLDASSSLEEPHGGIDLFLLRGTILWHVGNSAV